MTSPIHGVLVLDKPVGPTSHDMVAQVRRVLKAKAGHTGTLDPLASGVLPILLGKATRLMRFYQTHDKVYDAVIKLGQTSATYDAEGPIVSTGPVASLPASRIHEVLAGFTGVVEQLPPMFSALKVKGQPLYKAARQGLAVQRKPRLVTIHSLQLLEHGPDVWTIRVHCSSGTYVRCLAHDIGTALGCGAYLAGLRRLRSGGFRIEEALPPERLGEDWRGGFQPIEELLPELPRVELTLPQTRLVQHGNPVLCDLEGDFVRLFHGDRLIAIARREGSYAAPAAVFEVDPF